MTSAKNTSTTVADAVTEYVAQEMHNRVSPWLQTREGVASASAAAVVCWILWALVSAPLFADVLGAAVAVILVSIAARLWESRTAPRAPAFSLIRAPVDGGVDAPPFRLHCCTPCSTIRTPGSGGTSRDSFGVIGSGSPGRDAQSAGFVPTHTFGFAPGAIRATSQSSWRVRSNASGGGGGTPSTGNQVIMGLRTCGPCW